MMTGWRRRGRTILLAAVALYVAAFAARVYVRNYQMFLRDYLRWLVVRGTSVAARQPTHVFVLIADHFEPPNKNVAREWAGRYTAMAARHRDSSGRPPQHTWFYRGEQISDTVLQVLARMTGAGLGEVELHHHHAFQTEATLRAALTKAIDRFQQFGFLRTVDGRTQFAFVHGNSGLDNSNGAEFCGVDTEIRLLRELGAFADFTFPSLYLPSQPSSANSIYAVRDDNRPKSYDSRLPLSALRDGSADMMLFEGPLIVAPSLNLRHLFFDVEDGDIHAAEHASPRRADRWIRADLHVAERPDWIFVKLFAHGASTPEDVESVVGADYDNTLSYVERRYNDGRRYVLHYVTAREAYNLARAAAEGATGDPGRFLNAYVAPYAAGPHEESGSPTGASFAVPAAATAGLARRR